jgi:hypothetical protein
MVTDTKTARTSRPWFKVDYEYIVEVRQREHRVCHGIPGAHPSIQHLERCTTLRIGVSPCPVLNHPEFRAHSVMCEPRSGRGFARL